MLADSSSRGNKTKGGMEVNSMVFNILLTGVGGEGVLFTSVIVARAANLEGYEVRGTQLHGLAQRGGQIPTHLRIGKEVYSPTIPRGEADLILGLEPVEAARECYFASKKRTCFVVDTYPIVPVYTRLLKEKYPGMDEIRRFISGFAKNAVYVNASNICAERFGDPIYGNTMAVGVAVSRGMLPLRKKSLIEALKETAGKRELENDIKALRMGFEYKE